MGADPGDHGALAGRRRGALPPIYLVQRKSLEYGASGNQHCRVTNSEGFCDDRFAAVRKAFEENDEVGASVCVTAEGETVVDLWRGFADEARIRPWQRDTIVNVYSLTKTITALTALLLA